MARGVLIPLALIAATAGGFAGPAHAQDTTMSVTGLPSQIAVTPVTQDGVKQPRQLTLSVGDSAGGQAPREYVLRLGLGGLKGIVDVDAKPCVVAADQATCRIKVTDPDRVPGVALTLTAASGSKAGDAGALRVTGEADGQALKAVDATVEVGGANLVVAGTRLPTDLKVGDTAPLPVGLRNVGSASASGVLMAFRFTEGSKPARRFDNCEYGERSSFEEKRYVLCAFDVEVPPRAEFALPDDAEVEVGTAAFHELVQVSVYPDAPGMREYLRGGHPYERGSGPQLKLREIDSSSTGERYGNGNTWESTYYITNTADLSVTGADISGKVGDEVVADLGLRNDGPAWLGDVQDPTEFASLHVELPDGVSVVGLPKGCLPGRSGEYVCLLGPLDSDARLSFPFKLKLAKPLKEAHGQVRVRQAEWSRYDKNSSNDAAPIEFSTTPTSPGASAEPTPGTGVTGGDTAGEPSPGATSPSGGAHPSGEPGDGDLASTGAGTATWIAALAALLIGGGVAARATVRRRRA
ncbi:hypothetical protein [Streptomyces sp. NBC_01361]|uniref:hypothetical protein n=1 Tax=Streptomyces sp. NBC_01361 TaxID=2903838 RepID=UPI002E30AE51|nr:hypothetical protein [Streptomyces sp. NBC_01361]